MAESARDENSSSHQAPRLVHSGQALTPEEIAYVRAAHALTLDAIEKGCDVTHLPEGELWVTEVKTITYKYIWNADTKSFERASNKRRKPQMRKNTANKRRAAAF